MRNIRKKVGVLILGLISFSCQDVLEKFPVDKPDNSTFLKNTTELDLAVTGVYARLWHTGISAGGQWEYILDCATDIAWDRNGSILTFAGNGTLNSANATVASIWEHYYAGIGRANYVLDNLSKVEGASDKVLDEAEGQVRVLRAYWYSQLVTLFGDVPLIEHVQGIGDIEVARTPRKEVVDFILADLDAAAARLPLSWAAASQGRVTSGTALALKARVALADGRYDVAAQAAKTVMDSKAYSLYPDYQNLFNYTGESNNEVILEVNYNYGLKVHNAPVALFSRNAQGNSTKVPAQVLVDSYECTDGLTIDKSPLYDPKNPFVNRDPRLKQTIAVPGDRFLGFQFETHKDSLQCWDYNTTP
ncbi:MAG: RagB/SusD family nutrient uptake outer membrane protein, partial [Leadbetterella sp.]|nr:RagB/SusD family nutrient uptake outer membrane protein [Leadbetterella sp.]